MRGFLKRLLGSAPPRAERSRLDTIPEPSTVPTRPRARPTAAHDAQGLFHYGEYLLHPCGDPHLLFPLLRYLRDAIPDVSAGVWAWVRLCSTPQRVELLGGTAAQREAGAVTIRALDERIFEFDHMKQQGMDALLQRFFLSVFTYGAFAGEVVLSEDRRRIDRFYQIDPATVRFKRFPTSRRVVPYQESVDGEPIRLSDASFFYYGLDPDGDSPYGRSMLLSLPFVVRIQQQLLEDMGKAMHNAGYPQLHIRYTPPEREPGEPLSNYQDRVEQDYDTIRTALRQRKADSNFLTYDNIEIEYVGPTGQSVRWRDSYQAVSEQVVSALHLAPFLLGRNWGTTESWGRAQYRLITNNAVSVQRGAKRLCEWLRNLELALHGLPLRAVHHFEPHDTFDRLESAQADETRARTTLALLERGLLDEQTAREHLRLPNPSRRNP